MNTLKPSFSIKALASTLLIAAGLMASSLAQAQQSQRGAGWEMGVGAVYQDATTIDFDGGTTADLHADWGFALAFGYRFNPRLELQFALDWATVNYDANLVRATGAASRVSGDYESITPRVDLHFNFLDRPLTPYVLGGIGYSWIDTNIPNGRPQTGCWWDPWYGNICSTVQPTKEIDGFTYRLGLGVRWDIGYAMSLRLGLDRNWVDLGSASNDPYVDQAQVGLVWRY